MTSISETELISAAVNADFSQEGETTASIKLLLPTLLKGAEDEIADKESII